MSAQTDEETVKPCIQDRLRSIISRARDIFASLPIICLTILILITITLPEILTLTTGREVIIPIFSQISLESRFMIIFSFSVALFSSMQYKISKSLLRIEQQRNPPIIVAELSSEIPIIFVENKGGGIAWYCEIQLERLDLEGIHKEVIEKIYPWSGERIDFPEDWYTDMFNLYVGIKYYTKEDMPPDSIRKWERTFKKIGPFYDY